MVVLANFLKSQDSKSTFENNLTSKFSLSDPSQKKQFALTDPVVYFMAQFEIFSTANPPKTSQNIILCAIKMAHRMTSI